jgi:NADPH-dependent 2,4-dienoyl-CoA reductase/sulfur reductase-like enzyme
MAAAETAAGLGLSTLVLDENAGPGGQISRAVTSTPVRTRATLGEDYWRGAELAASFGASNGDYARAATVWSVGPGFDAEERENGLEVVVSLGGSAHLVGAKEVVLAMGALERPFPIPGWTLPGVMTAGAADARPVLGTARICANLSYDEHGIVVVAAARSIGG